MQVSIDARLEAGAYLSRRGELWLVLGKETDESGSITGMYEIENAKGELTEVGGKAPTYVHRRLAASATVIFREFKLERRAPDSTVPHHLNEQMEEHIQRLGLKPRFAF